MCWKHTFILCSSSSCNLALSWRTITCLFHSAMGRPLSSWVGTRESMSARITSSMGMSSSSSPSLSALWGDNIASTHSLFPKSYIHQFFNRNKCLWVPLCVCQILLLSDFYFIDFRCLVKCFFFFFCKMLYISHCLAGIECLYAVYLTYKFYP